MTLTANYQFTLSGIGGVESLSATASGTISKDVAETIAPSGADVQIAYTLDNSACTLFYITADNSLTVETNSDSAPDDTFTLAANVPQFYMTGVTASGLVTADITTIYATNTNNENVVLKVKSLEDATP